MEQAETPHQALITNDAIILGILLVILAFVFTTSSAEKGFWKKFYTVIPGLLMCYFLPSLLNTFNIVDPHESRLYFVASRYLLPACLVLLTLSVDLREIVKLGKSALIMFFTGTIGIVLGGPIALLIVSVIAPDIIGGMGFEELWRGMTTVAGSWIGGGANQTAMKILYEPSSEIFSVMVTVDVIVAQVFLALLLIGAGKSDQVDAYFKADASPINRLKKKMEDFAASVARIATLKDFTVMLAVCFASTAVAHAIADQVAPWIDTNYPELNKYSLGSGFFWIVVVATILGIVLSFTKYRKLEGAGASKVGSLFIYILVATIGMEMDVMAITRYPGAFLIGFIWMLFHFGLLILVGKLIKAPFFFLAVGSTANVGGAASAPVVAAAFHRSLAPVGALLAVLGYAIGTGAAMLCGILMESLHIQL